jgi:mono/diheme cytochrome c family protein
MGFSIKSMSRSAADIIVSRMSRTLLAAAIASSLIAQLAIGQEDAGRARRAQDLLNANCSRCHAIGRTGTSPHAAAPAFRTLSRKYPIEGLGEALAEGLSVGHPDMPDFVFEPEDVGAILDYLTSIQER